MRIASISTAVLPSNTANSIQVMKVCQALVQNGHEVQLFVPGQAGADWDTLADLYGVKARFAITWLPANPLWKRNDFALLAASRARAWKPDWVYAWTVQAAVWVGLRGQPALLEVHDLPAGRLGPTWLRAFLRTGAPERKRLVMITRALQRALEARYGRLLAPGRMLIAPNGVEVDRYRGLPSPGEARRALGLADGVTVGCTGHLYAGRGGDLFLGLAKRFPGVRFLWVGGRVDDAAAYRARAQAEGLENLTFTGFIANARLPLYQAAADILLMPYGRTIAGSSGGNSAEICSPMKLFDYLAVGRAILTSDLPVIREVLDERSAAFAPPEDLHGWSAALERLLADENLRLALAAKAQDEARSYDWRVREKRVIESF